MKHMETYKYIGILSVVFLLASCDKSNPLAEGMMTPKSDTATIETVYLDHSEDSVCMMIVETTGDNATVKWKLQPKTGEEGNLLGVGVLNDDIIVEGASSGLALKVAPGASFYLLTGTNPSTPVNLIPGNGTIDIDCKCSLRTQPEGDCSENITYGKKSVNVTCIKEVYCLECKAETTINDVVTHAGSGLLLKTDKLNVIPI
ncbi:MAG: hypothetical protein IBJ09_10615 [Bacteroidia bacterium]|nr:hypothetical protein [Bacteroidia bacterium]